MGWDNPLQQHGLGTSWLTSSIAEKDLGVTVDMNPQCSFAK